MTKILTIFTALILLASCSATRKAERQGIEKAKENIKAYEVVYPTLFESVLDTTFLTVTDTVKIEKYGIDTVLAMRNDTVFFENEKVKIEFIKTDIDTVFITKVLVKEQEAKIQYKTKTVTKTQYVTVPPKIEYLPSPPETIYKTPFWVWILVCVCAWILFKKLLLD